MNGYNSHCIHPSHSSTTCLACGIYTLPPCHMSISNSLGRRVVFYWFRTHMYSLLNGSQMYSHYFAKFEKASLCQVMAFIILTKQILHWCSETRKEKFAFLAGRPEIEWDPEMSNVSHRIWDTGQGTNERCDMA